MIVFLTGMFIEVFVIVGSGCIDAFEWYVFVIDLLSFVLNFFFVWFFMLVVIYDNIKGKKRNKKKDFFFLCFFYLV